jgi:agmatine deiminase
MPSEEQLHEGTWLQWPHQYEYGTTYRNRLDATWVAMTQALVQSEKVHIIAYNATEQSRITTLLTNGGVSLANVNFKLFPTNDVWARDNGPIFVKDSSGNLVIEDWGFNGWGGKFNFNHCNPIPTSIANAIVLPAVNLNSTMTIEGGSVAIDGRGVLMATRSSILSQSPANSVRNPGMTQAQAEAILRPYLGVTKFIWLNGVTGRDDITDMHIDGFAMFAKDSMIVTMNTADLNYWGVPAGDITTLYNATDSSNRPYHFVFVPLTQNNVITTYGENLGYKGSYVNYYVANSAILVPNYNDPNDAVANNIIQGLYPGKTVRGIDVRNLYKYGGMVHCVTQQQPAGNTPLPIHLASFTATVLANNRVRLDWRTISEISNYGFWVQRKRQTETEWYELPNSFLPGHGTTNEPHDYTFTDNTISVGTWLYRLKQVDSNGTVGFIEPITVSVLTSVEESLPTGFKLEQNYPNPFNPSTTIKFSLPENAFVTLKVYNLLGQGVQTLVKENLQKGNYEVQFNANALASGIYHYRIEAGEHSQVKKMVLIR